MSKTKFYRQCKLQRGCMHTTSWIPERLAHKGKYVKLKTAGMWTDGWQVIEVGTRESAEVIHSNNREYQHHRKRTDI